MGIACPIQMPLITTLVIVEEIWSLCSILAASGITYSETVVGAFNGIVLKQFIINALSSRNLKKGDVLIMDNASIHKIAPVRELLTQNGICAARGTILQKSC